MVELVRLTARHAHDLAGAAGEDPAAPWTTNPLAFVARAQRLRARGTQATFAICDAGRLVGLAVVGRDPSVPEQAELGYWIAPRDRGHGYATAAARRILNHGFRRMSLVLVFAHCPDAHGASARVLAKLGFRLTDVAPAKSGDGVVHRYELTSREWGKSFELEAL